MSAPLVSVVMPVRNGEPYLRQAVESVLTQTFREFELIVIDDGSDDASADIVTTFAEQDARVRLLKRAPRGEAAAIQEGVETARAELVARMDADDVCLPHRLERQFAVMSDDPELWVLGTAVTNINANGDHLDSPSVFTGQDIVATIEKWSPVWHPTVMFRRDRVLSIGGYRPEYELAEDYDLWLRIVKAGGRIGNLTEICLLYRIHDASVSIAQEPKQTDAAQRALADFRAS